MCRATSPWSSEVNQAVPDKLVRKISQEIDALMAFSMTL